MGRGSKKLKPLARSFLLTFLRANSSDEPSTTTRQSFGWEYYVDLTLGSLLYAPAESQDSDDD